MDNALYFRRARKIVPGRRSKGNGDKFAEVASLDADLRKLGYALSGDLAVELMRYDVDDLVTLRDDIIPEAMHLKGVRDYRPMYPNFPHQVMEATDAELYINAIIHYWSVYGLGTDGLLPVYNKLARPELEFDESKYEIVKLGTVDDYHKLLHNLASSKSAFSAQDQQDILDLNAFDFEVAIATSGGFPNRENKAFIGAEMLKRNRGWLPEMDTATDVLRLAVAMSDGDVSLAENTKFRNFKREERRVLMMTLDKVFNPVEDMLRYAQQWKRLGEKLHPGEFKQFPKAQAGFAAVRKNGAAKGFNSRVEASLSAHDPAVIGLLRARPGEFARRLDHVLRAMPGVYDITLEEFGKVADQVAPTVLLQLRNQMLNREGKRVFFPKGSVAKMQIIEDERTKLSDETRLRVAAICSEAMISQFKDRESLGKVYIDESLEKIAIPFGLRSASSAVKTLGRGSRLSFDASVLRFFIWWKNSEGGGYYSNTDIDLSAVVLDDSFNSVFDITYYNMRERGATHSGDITSAPRGASEFIDIEVQRIVEQGGRYVAMTLHSYSGQLFGDMPEVFAGFMERNDLDSGEIYEPKTVVDKVDVTANSRQATPFIFDLVTGEAIWVDLTTQVRGRELYGNVHNTKRTITDTVDAMVNLTPPNLYDLFVLHAIARGTLVYDRDEADIVYALDGDVTPFDTEDILANYL